MFISFQVPSVDVQFPSILDVASIMFAERCCYFFVIIGMVLCLQSSGLKCSVGLIVFSTCLFICSRFVVTSLIFPIIQLSSYIFLPGRILWMCCVGKRSPPPPEPFDHVVLSCCRPGGKKSIICGSLWCCDFSSQSFFYRFVE